jgi:phosphopantothenoylcysteine decarboxylase/phosphopantothenate--cysteine ligase
MKGKNIIVGITGSIAAYKAAILIRLLIKDGAKVKVIMTPLAKEFITPLTLATLSKNPILIDFFNPENGDWNSHVDLGLWADAYLIAPATANTLSKMAYGIADNLLLTTYLSARCPVFFAPAMDMDMFQHQATQQSINILTNRGNHCIQPSSGELASGLIGKGRMEDPEIIVKYLSDFFQNNKLFSGKKILITAGPTYEAIDPVRFIGNHSSGKMGFALAEKAAEMGADVTLVSGLVNLTANHKNIKRIDIISAEEMYNAVKQFYQDSDINIFAAAVADYTPVNKSDKKIKKENEILKIELKKTIDIAKILGKEKKHNQINIGFALETDNELINAQSKLLSKNFDFIVLNSLQEEGAGFKHDTNKITIIDRNNNIQNFELKTKQKVAEDILNKIIEFI